MFVNLVGKIKSENIAEQPEAEPHGTVLSAQDLEGIDVENEIILSQFSFFSDCSDIVLAVLDEATIASRFDVSQ